MRCRCVPQSHHFSYIFPFLGWKVDTFDPDQFAPVWIYWKKEILTRGSTMSKSISADEMSRRSRVTIWPAHPSLTKLQLLHHPPPGLQKFSLLNQSVSRTHFCNKFQWLGLFTPNSMESKCCKLILLTSHLFFSQIGSKQDEKCGHILIYFIAVLNEKYKTYSRTFVPLDKS